MRYLEFALPCNLKPVDSSNTSVLHFNARSVRNKVDQIDAFLYQFSFKFDFILVSETWCQNDVCLPSINGYRSFSVNRTYKRGGGVALYATNCRHCDQVPEFCLLTADYEILTVKTGAEIISTVYRPPTGSIERFLDFFESLLDYASLNRFRLVCGGDFNIDILNDNNSSNVFITRLFSAGFMNTITTPTRVTPSCSSCLDLIITNFNTDISIAGTLSSDISDHCPVFMAYPGISKSNPINSFTFQLISEDRLESFKQDVSAYDWSCVMRQNDASEAYAAFIKPFVRLYSKHFPFTTVKRSKKLRKPWITQEHVRAIKEKNRLYHAFLRTRSQEKLKEFKAIRNKLNATLKQAKAIYYNNLFNGNGKVRPDTVWKIINAILGRNKENHHPQMININGNELGGIQLADYFNTYFVSANAPVEQCVQDLTTLKHSPVNSIFLEPTDETEVFKTFRSLNNSKALDKDDIQIKPVKYVLESIVTVLAYIYNLAFETGTFPRAMKEARVRIIHKGGDKNDKNNYRPISVLPVFSKGLEKIIFSRLTNFLNKNETLTDSQFGFRKGRSTETALLAMKERIAQSIDSGLFSLGIFIDFSKAFDRLSHDILINKLSFYGIRGSPLSLMTSYLKNRTQCVCIDSQNSSSLPVLNGVPQGSVLGPLLFNVYVNDIVNIDLAPQYFIYADDSTLLFTGSDPDFLVLQCNNTLEKLHHWSKSNSVKINPVKTKAVLFRPKNKMFTLQRKISLFDRNIELVDEHKVLGITFSCNLSWNSHVQSLCRRLSVAVAALSCCRVLMPVNIKIQLYYALFTSQMNYCSLVWSSTTKSNIDKISVLQKAALRHIARVDRMSSTRELFPNFNIIRFEHHYNYRLLNWFFFSPCDSKNFLISIASLRPHDTAVDIRDPAPWFVPRFRTQYKMQTLKHNLPVLLNKYKDESMVSRKRLREHFTKLPCTS